MKLHVISLTLFAASFLRMPLLLKSFNAVSSLSFNKRRFDTFKFYITMGSALSTSTAAEARRNSNTIKTDQDTNKVCKTVDSESASIITWENVPSNAQKVHLIVLVHGWQGNHLEMNSFQKAIAKHSATYLSNNNKNNDNQQEVQRDKMVVVVHNTRINEGKTSDGIEAGGTRLARELDDILLNITTAQSNQRNVDESASSNTDTSCPSRSVSLSFVGNSLGGLYARYALGEMNVIKSTNTDSTNDHVEKSESSKNSNKIKLQTFVTTATPHLGVSQHTYLPIPRWAETTIAHAMQTTGRDLFRVSNVIERMAVEKTFLDPLRGFNKRVAYANAHATDFQVPTATAAFITTNTSNPTLHYRVDKDEIIKTYSKNSSQAGSNDNNNDDATIKAAAEAFLRLIVETKPNSTTLTSTTLTPPILVCDMAQNLDSLGWTKVFCDVRSTLFSIPLSITRMNSKQNENNKDGNDIDPFYVKDSYTSAELVAKLAGLHGSSWSLPLGHAKLVANSKDGVAEWFNAGGQPLVDFMAEQLVRSIFRD